jgi:hypothetical protein
LAEKIRMLAEKIRMLAKKIKLVGGSHAHGYMWIASDHTLAEILNSLGASYFF